jgi:hypothetical protein
MTPRAMLTQLSAGRIAFGISLVVAPHLIGGMWLGKDGQRTTVGALARGFGARDLALGAGTLAAMRTGQPLRTWLVGGLVSDAVDLAATVAARDSLPPRSVPLLSVLAGSAIVTGLVNLASEDAPASQPAV